MVIYNVEGNLVNLGCVKSLKDDELDSNQHFLENIPSTKKLDVNIDDSPSKTLGVLKNAPYPPKKI